MVWLASFVVHGPDTLNRITKNIEQDHKII